jgi:hypothetical protein
MRLVVVGGGRWRSVAMTVVPDEVLDVVPDVVLDVVPDVVLDVVSILSRLKATRQRPPKPPPE